MYSLNKLSLGLLPDSNLVATEFKNNEIVKIGNYVNNEIIDAKFPIEQYFKYETKKTQITLHHTVSGRGSLGDLGWWKNTKDRIATSVIIDWEGRVYECFDSKYWGHHLGIKSDQLQKLGFKDYDKRNVILNKSAIGIEIDSWGGLVEYQGKYYPAKISGNKFIPNLSIKPIENVVVLNKQFRGFWAFEKYTDKQIDVVCELISYYSDKHKISKKYNEKMWDLSIDALSGVNGIWGHVSYRADKSDIYPDERLIKRLKSL